MKVIDLLNKIANGEEVPEKIKYRNKIFIYDKDNQCYVVENYNIYNDLLMELSNHKGTDLHYELEIIEEHKEETQEHKIPEKLDQTLNRLDMNEDYYRYIMENRFKINEILDYLEEIK